MKDSLRLRLPTRTRSLILSSAKMKPALQAICSMKRHQQVKCIESYFFSRQIRWALFRCSCFGVGVFFSTVYKAVPSRDRTVTETTRVLLALFRSHFKLGGSRCFGHTLSRCFGHQKNVTSLHPLKMADSVPLDAAVFSVPIPIARQKTVLKGVPKAVLSDDVKLKLAEHINSDMEVRHVLLISGKRNMWLRRCFWLQTNISFHHRSPRQRSANG
jgi:hypothetical protein